MSSKKKRKVSHSQIGAEIGKLVEEKQAAYGDSFGRSGECLRQMFPDGIPLTQYDDVLTIARILDKLFRIATNKDAFGENPYKDITGYGILGYVRHQKNQEQSNATKRNSRTNSRQKSIRKSNRK